MLDIGIIVPELAKYGGAEKFLVECLVRWQHDHRLTVYTAVVDERLLAEAGLHKVTLRKLRPPFEGENSVILNAALLPKIWERQVGTHDIYHAHLWPMHLLDLHPMVWFPHEPLRGIHDLRHDQKEEVATENRVQLHLYPKENYDPVGDVRGSKLDLEATLQALTVLDTTGRPDRVVANSRYMAEYLQKIYKLPKIEVVYPGVAPEKAIELPHAGDIVLAIGQLWRHKRMRLIIEAIRQVEGVQLYIVGSGPEKQRLVTVAKRMGVSDRVFFLHGLDNHEVQILLARCLCVAFTPIREPFGIVALEALAAGKPLVAVNEGGFCEIVDEECAFLVPPLPGEIADRIRRLQEDRALARRMGAHGREVARNFTWDRTAAELLAIIEACRAEWMAARRPPPDSPSKAPLVGIHYFTWYGEGLGNRHWSDNLAFGGVSDIPQLGYYGSLSGETAARHLDLMEEMDIDFVIFNLHVDEDGIDLHQLSAAETMIDVAAQRGSPLRFAVALCLYTARPPLIEAAMAKIRESLLGHARYQNLRGKPLLFLFWTGLLDGNYMVIRLLKALSEDCLRIAVSLRLFDSGSESRRTFDLFDAASLFSPLELSAPEHWEETWQRAYDGAGGMPARLRIATLSPGYDDTHLQDPNRHGNLYRRVPRDNGATYRRSADFALRQSDPPEMLIVSTFNEFHENTHVEPSLDWGRFYVAMTRDLIAEARAMARRHEEAIGGERADLDQPDERRAAS